MGSDLTVVNSARVSFSKKSDWDRSKEERFQQQGIVYDLKLGEKDKKLIKYLAEHDHWSPFAHAQIQLHIKAPFFAARQLGKHQVGLVWNEVSRRYVVDKPDIYMPDGWHAKPDNAKQGRSDAVFDGNAELHLDRAYSYATQHCYDVYNDMIERGVAPEQARMVLPLATYTEWYWTGSLLAFARVCNQRLGHDAQAETGEIAKQISDIIAPLFPVSWKYLSQNIEN